MHSSTQSSELWRLASFARWPDGDRSANPCRLSRSGFFYAGTGNSKTVVCCRCGLSLDDWSDVDDLLRLHQRGSSQCAATANGISGTAEKTPKDDNNSSRRKETIPTAGIEMVKDAYFAPCSAPAGRSPSLDRSKPDFDQLRSERVRLETFHDWPPRATRIVDARELAEAGLFYTGQRDRVQCAFCRGFLRNWIRGDRPADEHRKHYPDCPFVRGLDVGNVAAVYKANIQEIRRSLGDTMTSGHCLSQTAAVSTSNYTRTAPVDVGQRVEEKTNRTAAADEEHLSLESKEILEDNRQLKETRTCKVCMDREVDTVFLPCGHLVCCSNCSPALRNCAICRALIRGTVKTFLID